MNIRLLQLFLAAFLLGNLMAAAQTNPNEYVEEKPVLMKNEMTFGLNVHSSGWGVQFRRSFNITGFKKLTFEGDFVGMKHPKEIKSINQAYDNPRSFVYGKLNSLSILRCGTGRQITIYSKAERNGVEVRLNYSGGLALGILKPVYLNILTEAAPNSSTLIVVSKKYDPETDSLYDIYGRAPFTEGLSELSFRPGIYGKIGFNFEYAPVFEDVKAIEIGAIVDAFPTVIPIMAMTKNKQLFLSFYITIMYGRKW